MNFDGSVVPLRVLVCDDTRAHTELLADSLKRDGGLLVVSAPSGSNELIQCFESYRADVLLLSSNLDEQPGRGVDVLRTLRSVHGDVRTVLLLGSSNRELMLEAFRAGARGVFSKEDSVGILPRCVRKVHEGQIWANTEQLSVLIQAWARSHKVRAVNAGGIDLLSKRECEIVSSVAEGLTNREIAEKLGLSPHTVKNCLFRIFDKLGVSSRVELLFLTLSEGTNGQVALRSFLETGLDGWMHEDTALSASRHAAEQGALLAQLALAQFYSSRGTSKEDALYAYKWCSVVKERLSQLCEEIANTLTVDQLVAADNMAAGALPKTGPISSGEQLKLTREVPEDSIPA